ncbi:MAG: TetR/AcrR family transcriptional regulator [Candidatus Mcinerneyibacterium aminivorans]|uniref:TetR/AcrR family transcriptional regulator n=1 Tax=Candidatus Mcinerneyibacterium aminivorans TaxID=2703815 RepID=A0A5D0MMG6_9BACT|nr:MAG: TetR/AcrR family transcriptional regulator [Candidatus Mcinerneyibacterium aminivorans]
MKGGLMSHKRKWEIKIKKQKIADAAISLFLEKGLANATLKDIASKIGYSKSSISSYFDSKSDIFLFLIERDIELIKDIIKKAKKRISENKKNILEYFLDNELSNFLDSKTMTKLLNKQFKEALNMFSDNEKLIERVYDLRKSQIKLYNIFLSEYVHDEKTKELYSYFLLSILHSISHYQIHSKDPIERKKLLEKTKEFIFNGLNKK